MTDDTMSKLRALEARLLEVTNEIDDLALRSGDDYNLPYEYWYVRSDRARQVVAALHCVLTVLREIK